MFTHRKTLLLIGVIGASLTVAGCAPTAPADSNPSSSEVSEDFNNQDIMFVQMMLPHHSQAVEMSDMILAKDDIDPAVSEIAQQIKDAQGPEIDQMNELLTSWGAEDESMSGMDSSGMDGMMSDEEMNSLESATGVEASRLFLEQMTEHHNGAIEMAEMEVDGGQNPEAIELAESIVESQEAEITEMEQVLATL